MISMRLVLTLFAGMISLDALADSTLCSTADGSSRLYIQADGKSATESWDNGMALGTFEVEIVETVIYRLPKTSKVVNLPTNTIETIDTRLSTITFSNGRSAPGYYLCRTRHLINPVK